MKDGKPVIIEVSNDRDLRLLTSVSDDLSLSRSQGVLLPTT